MDILPKSPLFNFFGDAQRCPVGPKAPEFSLFCEKLFRSFGLSGLILLLQTHGINGLFVSKDEEVKGAHIFEQDGDFIVSNVRNIAIGVLTADCLPIIFYDPEKQVVAVAHAGWRGAVAGVGLQALAMMQQKMGTEIKNVQVQFGPAAHRCCYQIKEDFLVNLAPYAWWQECVEERKGVLYFDLILFNRRLLESIGIIPENIDQSSCICTICNSNFHSFRRDGDYAGRQITAVWLG